MRIEFLPKIKIGDVIRIHLAVLTAPKRRRLLCKRMSRRQFFWNIIHFVGLCISLYNRGGCKYVLLRSFISFDGITGFFNLKSPDVIAVDVVKKRPYYLTSKRARLKYLTLHHKKILRKLRLTFK